MAFRAQYAGRCRACGGSFPAGTRITGSAGNWRHATCGERRVSVGFTRAAPPAPVVRPAAPAPVAPVAAPIDRLAPAINAETASVAEAARRAAQEVAPSWVPVLAADPANTREREAAVAARRARAAEVAARNRTLAPALYRPAAGSQVATGNEGAERFARLDLDDAPAAPAAPEAESEGARRFALLDLD